MTKKILLGAEHSGLDTLALFYLSDIAKQEGWEPRIVLSKGSDYKEFTEAIQKFKPDIFGITLYTGNHEDIENMFNRVRKENKNLETVVGGPHPTYFPEECSKYTDYVVVGEGFNSLRRILCGTAKPGIVSVKQTEEFPSSDRERFYRENPLHDENPIKSIVTGVGCFFSCTHCYNSNRIGEVPGITAIQVKEMESAIGSKRFFPAKQRPVDEVISEIKYVQQVSPKTKMLFLQDDIFGGNIEWLREFTQKYNARLPFHANMRFELVNPKKTEGRERVELLKKAGCTGLTLAIESSSEIIRKEVLNRNTPEDLIFDAMKYLSQNGLKIRTNQMIGLPYGATKNRTKMNLEADLDTLELNVRLREQTGSPTIPWASTLVPYLGTKISKYCEAYGYHKESQGDIRGNSTYRVESVLKHPKKWVGPTLSENTDCWLSETEQAKYKSQLKVLMDCFPVFGLISNGHEVAREFLTKGQMEFEDIYNLMDKHKVFDEIRDGEQLRGRLLKQEDKSTSAINDSVRHHVYDHDLFKINKTPRRKNVRRPRESHFI